MGPLYSGLSTVFADNIGADEQTFFTGLPVYNTATNQVQITGSPFTYDPSLGNLLVTISTNVPTSPNSNDPVFIDYDYAPGGDLFSRVASLTSNTSGSVTNDYGFVTGFDTIPASPAPEPSQVGMMALMGLALGGLLLRARRRQSAD